MSVDTSSTEAAYLTKDNILCPESRANALTEMAVRARQHMADHHNNVTVSGGSIKKGA